MTFKSILTHVEPSSSPLESKHLAYALQLAEAFKAHLVALVFETEVMEPTAEKAAGDAVGRDAHVATQIREAAESRSVSCEVRGRSSFAYGFPDVFIDHARVSDLSVIGYGPSRTMAQRMLAGQAIFFSGRPTLIVPEAVNLPALPRRVAIAWDATPASVRALHNALPLILQAEETIVFSVTDDKELRRGHSGLEVTNLLARHGATARFEPILLQRRNVMVALTEAAAFHQASLLVMGCLGHSPIYEMVFGSATTDLLRGQATMAVLASA